MRKNRRFAATANGVIPASRKNFIKFSGKRHGFSALLFVALSHERTFNPNFTSKGCVISWAIYQDSQPPFLRLFLRLLLLSFPPLITAFIPPTDSDQTYTYEYLSS